MPDFRKQSLYFPTEMLEELEREAERVDRTISWVVQRCIRTGMSGVRQLRAAADPALESQREAGKPQRDV